MISQIRPPTWFKRNTVISIINDRVLNYDVVASVDIPPVRVRDKRGGGRDGVDVDVVKGDVLAFVHQVEPFWGVDHFDVLLIVVRMVYHIES